MLKDYDRHSASIYILNITTQFFCCAIFMILFSINLSTQQSNQTLSSRLEYASIIQPWWIFSLFVFPPFFYPSFFVLIQDKVLFYAIIIILRLAWYSTLTDRLEYREKLNFLKEKFRLHVRLCLSIFFNCTQLNYSPVKSNNCFII